MASGLGSAAVAEDNLSNKLESVAADWQIRGMAVAVVKDGQLVFVRGFGIRRLGSNLPVTAHTRFSIGSCTKSFTAAVLGTLVDQQSISWDDPVIRRLHGFEMPNADDTGRVTVRDLLAHRTGLSGGDLISWGSSFSRQEVVDRIRFLLPIAPLRSAFHYNNNIYGAAGEVAQATSGRTWDELVITGFLDPLEMTSTTTSISAIPAEAERASPHAAISGLLQPIPPINEDNIAAAGSIWSTATDMAQWMLMLLGDGELADRRYLAKTTLEEMWKLQTPMPLKDEWGRWPDSARPHFSG